MSWKKYSTGVTDPVAVAVNFAHLLSPQTKVSTGTVKVDFYASKVKAVVPPVHVSEV